MAVYKILANRQLAGYAGSDKYINVSGNTEYQEIFSAIESGDITSINGKSLREEEKGKTKNIHFIIEDRLLNKKYDAFLAKSNELRLQLTNYVNSEKIIPGDIITLVIKRSDTDCKMYIKSDRLYKYVLEKKSQYINKYRILIESPRSTGNCGKTVSDLTDGYLSNYNIENTGECLTFGKDPTEFNVYVCENCDKKYIGIPFYTNLQIDCFNDIEEIMK